VRDSYPAATEAFTSITAIDMDIDKATLSWKGSS
jgi:hypothetical protein